MSRSLVAHALVVPAFGLLLACGGPEPATPASPATGPSTEPAPATTEQAASEPSPEPRKPRKPFPVNSLCGDVVTVVFGEDPKAENGSSRTIAPGSSIEGWRDDAGNQTVWLLDDAGEPLLKVNVTRGMKRVEIGRSCRTLDAR